MLLASKGGLSNGGVGICKIGRGGALLVRGSVTPGIVGISGGKDSAETDGAAINAASSKATEEDIIGSDVQP